MAIPDYQTCMLPFLQYAESGDEIYIQDHIKKLADHFQLTPEETEELLPSGKQRVMGNRVGWARTYLKKAGLIEYTRRGHFRITEAGKKLLKDPPEAITVEYLKGIPEFQDWIDTSSNSATAKQSSQGPTQTKDEQTPEERLEQAWSEMKEAVIDSIQESIDQISPTGFESLVLDVLLAMGYGGSRKDAANAVGGPGDRGIDGIINEDRLGLDAIYVQAKKWENNVGGPEIRNFAGALSQKKANKGIFIATSKFTPEAVASVREFDKKIVLIDGRRLAELMFEHGVGVDVENTYPVKKLDTDYFETLGLNSES